MIRRNGWFVANNVVVCCIRHTVWTIDETNETFFIVFFCCVNVFCWCHHVSPMNYFHPRPGSVLLKISINPLMRIMVLEYVEKHVPPKKSMPLFAGKYTIKCIKTGGSCFFHFPRDFEKRSLGPKDLGLGKLATNTRPGKREQKTMEHHHVQRENDGKSPCLMGKSTINQQSPCYEWVNQLFHQHFQ